MLVFWRDGNFLGFPYTVAYFAEGIEETRGVINSSPIVLLYQATPDPHREPAVSGFVKVVRPLPRHEFLRLLASSDIYLERYIDEEIGNVALEALAMGVSVAKLTHQLFVGRVDYDGVVIHATSVKELAEQLALVIDKREILDEYGQRSINYVRRKRTWNNVKSSLYERLGI